MKRSACLLLALILIFTTIPLATAATTSGKCGDNLTWSYSPGNETLTISGTGLMYNSNDYDYHVNVDEQPWLFYQLGGVVRHIVVCEGVTSLGYEAFAKMANVETISLPSTLRLIDEYAFAYTSSLREINIPDGVSEIPTRAFFKSGLSTLQLPSSVKTIWTYAFESSMISTINLENVVNIGERAFLECQQLRGTVNLGKVKTIGTSAFRASSISGVVLGNGLKEIAPYAFAETELKSLDVPSSVKLIDSYAFYNAPLQTLTFHEGLETIESAAFMGIGVQELRLPSTVRVIQGAAFQSWNLEYVQLSEGVTKIYEYAFYSSDVLSPSKGLVVPSTVTLLQQQFQTELVLLGKPTSLNTMERANIYSFWAQEDLPTDYTPGRVNFYQMEKEVISLVPGESYPLNVAADEASLLFARSVILDNGTLVAQGCGTDLLTISDGETTTYHLVQVQPVEDVPVQPLPFEDVDEGAWYYPAVAYTFQNNLMNGTGTQEFSPNTTMTREMLVTVLWRFEGSPTGYSNPFTDVSTKWSKDAIAWAAAEKIVSGVGNNTFDPQGEITREQLALILMRYAKSKGIDTSEREALSKFPDGNKVSPWAKEGLEWAVAKGLITGTAEGGKTYVDAQGSATRAQVATILMRFIENNITK
ncbi:MAG: leucine-rich repeat protein [Oscillospiraceae bacterium]|nr:leucine-rich repeat protein [Oscillospiraceae bacterium]